MKILYVSPENTVGTLGLWKKAHEAMGNECTIITLYENKYYKSDAICLNLPLIKSNEMYLRMRHVYYQFIRDSRGDYRELVGFPPKWKPNTKIENRYFQFRDWLWHFKVEKIIKELSLFDYDVFHFEWGLEFYRDGRFVKKLKKLNKHIVCTYHGQDMRSRGVIPAIDNASILNLTSELDLISKHPDLKYLFLPFDTKKYNPELNIDKKIKICHSPTNRYYKGSETIIPICRELAKKKNVEFILIENMPNNDAMKIKHNCDILIDQIYNRGGWGYGMNSIEALSMGLCCATELVGEYKQFIPDHPFVSVNAANLKNKLENLIDNPEKILEHKKKSIEWVFKYHDIYNVTKSLYKFYKNAGILVND